MADPTNTSADPLQGSRANIRHPGVVLTILAGTQLMVVLDVTIVNIALPHIQRALGFSDTGLSWVLNAYTLTFGGLLLLGGRAGDILGRRRVFMFGIALFALASMLGGFAQSEAWLLGARALQGLGGAIASPTALALIAVNFREGPERNRAFGVFAAVSASGSAIGLLLGGVLTEWLSWRWVLFVNVPIGAALLVSVPFFVSETRRHPGHFDISGALSSTVGMVALVYGFIRASSDGWSDPFTIGSFGAAVVLLTLFVLIETRTTQPITPLRMFRDRNRAGTYLIMLCLAAALFGMFFFLTQFVQDVLGFSPIRAGLAFLPVSAVVIVVAQIVSRWLQAVGPKPFMFGGALFATGGLLWLSRIHAHSSYVDGVLGPTLVFGIGMGSLFVPLTVTALSGVRGADSGAASSLLNVMQQIGGSLGLAVLVTVFGTASRNEAHTQVARFLAQASPQAKTEFQRTGKLPAPYSSEVFAHGASQAFTMSVVFGLVALLASVFLIHAPQAQPGDPPAGTGTDPSPGPGSNGAASPNPPGQAK